MILHGSPKSIHATTQTKTSSSRLIVSLNSRTTMRVYYFTRPWKWEEFRKERFGDELKAKIGKVSKDDKGDPFLLWKVYEFSLSKRNTRRYFKPLTIVHVELRPLLMNEEMLYRNLQRVRSASIIGVDVGGGVKILEEMVEDARREIVDKAIKIIPGFMDIANSLGLSRDDVNGLAGLARLLVYDKFTSYKKSINYLGLYKARGRYGRRNKKYSHKIQRYLIMLTNTILDPVNFYLSFSLYVYGLVSVMFSYACIGLHS